jgi:branched-chain amino acid transport system ATP-binding protein
MPALLEVDGLEVGYGEIVAVRDLSLRVEPGEAVAVLGPNGAGKTSAVEAIVGLVPKRRGSVRLAGSDLTRRSASAIVRRGMVLVSQNRDLFPSFTVDETLALVADRRAVDPTRVLADTYRLFPALAERRRQLSGTLSGGEQQMLALARALVAEPTVLLLDEPSANLAPAIVQALRAALLAVRARGIPLVLVEQNIEFAADIADRAIVLAAGSVVWQGPLDADRAAEIGGFYFS